MTTSLTLEEQVAFLRATVERLEAQNIALMACLKSVSSQLVYTDADIAKQVNAYVLASGVRQQVKIDARAIAKKLSR